MWWRGVPESERWTKPRQISTPKHERWRSGACVRAWVGGCSRAFQQWCNNCSDCLFPVSPLVCAASGVTAAALFLALAIGTHRHEASLSQLQGQLDNARKQSQNDRTALESLGGGRVTAAEARTVGQLQQRNAVLKHQLDRTQKKVLQQQGQLQKLQEEVYVAHERLKNATRTGTDVHTSAATAFVFSWCCVG